MALDDNPFQAKQAGAVIPPMINPPLEVPQNRQRHHRDGLGQQVARELLAQELAQHLRQTLGRFQRHVADKTVAHHDIGVAFEDPIALDVTDEVEPGILQ